MSELRFDIEGKIPDGADLKSVNEMLQALLEERFGLKLHCESKAVSGYALTVAKGGPKLTPAAPPKDPEEMKQMREELLKKAQAANKQRMEEIMRDRAASGQVGPASPGMRISIFVEPLADEAGNHFHTAERLAGRIQMPILDMTGLEGKYDLEIDIIQGPGDTPEYAALQAVAKLGLKLESRKVPTVFLVVDKAEKTPRKLAGNSGEYSQFPFPGPAWPSPPPPCRPPSHPNRIAPIASPTSPTAPVSTSIRTAPPPMARRWFYTSPAGIHVLDLATKATKLVVQGRARIIVSGHKTQNVYSSAAT
jgi:uncharacterized protein (TIGR03435 family)